MSKEVKERIYFRVKQRYLKNRLLNTIRIENICNRLIEKIHVKHHCLAKIWHYRHKFNTKLMEKIIS
jgi:hypothetical protein